MRTEPTEAEWLRAQLDAANAIHRNDAEELAVLERLEDAVRAGRSVLILLDDYTDPPGIVIAERDENDDCIHNGIGATLRIALADWMERRHAD